MTKKKPINIEIGQYVKECRENAGLTQEILAEMVDLGVKHISAIECGSVGLSLPTLRRMSRALSVPADHLLFGTTNEAEQQSHASELQVLFSRLSRLPPNKFRIAKDIIDKLLEAFAIE